MRSRRFVVEHKWLASVQAAIDGEVQRVTQDLARRVEEMEQRYYFTLPRLTQEAEAFRIRVEAHLLTMGVSWG